MQGGRGVKIVIFMALRCKVMENTRKTEGAWGKSFSGPPRGPEEQRTYEQRTRLFTAEPLAVSFFPGGQRRQVPLGVSMTVLGYFKRCHCRSSLAAGIARVRFAR